LLLGLDRNRLRPEEDPENLAEDHLFDYQRDSYGKDQSGDDRHECDELLHMSSPRVLEMEWQSAAQRACY
jgi:hypothetical protein